MFPGIRIRIISVRDQDQLDIHSFAQKHVDAAQGSVDAGGIAVVHNGHVVREPLDQTNLPLRQCRAAGGHDIGDAQLVHGKHIQIAFDKIAVVPLRDFVLGEPDTVQRQILDIDVTFLGVDVFRDGLVGLQGPGSEGNDAPAYGMDRKYDPIIEAVTERAVFLVAGAKSGVKQVFFLVSGRLGSIGEGSAAGRRPSETIFRDGRIFQAPGIEIIQSDGSAFIRFQLLLKELSGIFRDQHQALVAFSVRDVFSGLLLFNNLNIVFLGEVSQGFSVGQVFVIHDESHGRSPFVATETIVHAFGGNDVERRGLLVVEGTTRPVLGAAPLERHEVADDFLDLRHVENLLYRLLGNHFSARFLLSINFPIIYLLGLSDA